MMQEPIPHEVAPFTDWMGVSLLSIEPGKVKLQLTQRRELDNRRGVLHGGAIATLLDSAMARAARSVEPVADLASTVDLHIQYMRPAKGTVVATGLVESQTRATAFCRGEVHDEGGTLVAAATATLRLHRRAAGAVEEHPTP
jgi:acyl-CoA thioesterase